MAEIVDIPIRPEATDDRGTGWSVDGEALLTDWNFAIIAYTEAGLLAKDIGPPRALGRRSKHGTLFCVSLVPGRLWGCADFAVDFMGVGVVKELFEQGIGWFELDKIFSGENGRQTILEVMMAAFNFAFGLWGWGKSQGHAIEVECRPQLSKGFGGMGKKEGVIIHVQGQGQTVSTEGAV